MGGEPAGNIVQVNDVRRARPPQDGAVRLLIEVEAVSPLSGRVTGASGLSSRELLLDHWHEVSFVGWLGLLRALSETLERHQAGREDPPPPSTG